MTEHKTDLMALAQKYDNAIELLEKQLAEAKRKKDIILEAVNLLEKEGIFKQDKLFELSDAQLKDKYSQMSMPVAIQDVLKSSKKELSGEEIYNELTRYGFKSGSKNLKADVYSRLYRLEKDKKLFSTQEGGIKKYRPVEWSDVAP